MATITRNYSTPQTNLQSPPLTIILTVIIIVFFLVGFFSVIVCRCLMKSAFRRLNLLRTSPSANVVSNSDIAANNGLDPCIIKSFPTFLYSTVKDLRKEKYGLECAIYLVEFEDDSMLRLLTFCCHVFHQECIDFWLESHNTCPVCRGNLNSTQNETIALEEGAISIEIRENREEQEDRVGNHNEVEKSLPKTSVVEQANEALEYERERFSRSHSTGHSIARIRSEKEEDKYTLMLPEHVNHWTGSSTTYGEISRHKGCGFG